MENLEKKKKKLTKAILISLSTVPTIINPCLVKINPSFTVLTAKIVWLYSLFSTQ